MSLAEPLEIDPQQVQERFLAMSAAAMLAELTQMDAASQTDLIMQVSEVSGSNLNILHDALDSVLNIKDDQLRPIVILPGVVKEEVAEAAVPDTTSPEKSLEDMPTIPTQASSWNVDLDKDSFMESKPTLVPSSVIEIRRLRREVEYKIANIKSRDGAKDWETSASELMEIVILYQQANECNSDDTRIARSIELLKSACFDYIFASLEGRIYKIVFRLSEPTDEVSELLALAKMDLNRAALNYDPSYGAIFGAYAAAGIEGIIKRHHRDMTIQQSAFNRTAYEAYAVIKDVLSEGGDIEAVAKAIGKSVEATKDILAIINSGPRHGSIDDIVGVEPSTGWIDSPEDIVDSLLLNPKIQNALLAEAKDPRKKLIMEMRLGIKYRDGELRLSPHFHQYSQTDIAKVIGCSQVHVGRLLKQIEHAIKEALI